MNSCAEGNDNDWNCSGFRGRCRYEFIPDSSALSRE
jgi:hypothetical protein